MWGVGCLFGKLVHLVSVHLKPEGEYCCAHSDSLSLVLVVTCFILGADLDREIGEASDQEVHKKGEACRPHCEKAVTQQTRKSS